MKTTKCKNPDCNEPRMMNEARGTYLTYCELHQREYWRDHSGAKRPGKNHTKQHPALHGSVGDNGTTIETESHQPARTSRLSDAEKQAMIDRVRARVQAKAPVPAVEKTETAIAKLAEMLGSPAANFIQSASDMNQPDAIDISIHHCADACADCVYRDVVAVLEQRVPGVREIVTGLKLIHGRK